MVRRGSVERKLAGSMIGELHGTMFFDVDGAGPIGISCMTAAVEEQVKDSLLLFVPCQQIEELRPNDFFGYVYAADESGLPGDWKLTNKSAEVVFINVKPVLAIVNDSSITTFECGQARPELEDFPFVPGSTYAVYVHSRQLVKA